MSDEIPGHIRYMAEEVERLRPYLDRHLKGLIFGAICALGLVAAVREHMREYEITLYAVGAIAGLAYGLPYLSIKHQINTYTRQITSQGYVSWSKNDIRKIKPL